MHLDDVWPPFGVRVTCGPVELTALRDDDIPAVVDVVLQGIEDADGPMPFLRPWHLEDPETLPASLARHYWQARASFVPEKWQLMLVVRRDGEVVGVTDLLTRGFTQTRVVETGSWLGRAHQRRGTGTLMRQMLAVLCFDHLGAEVLVSAHVEGNRGSRRISERLGYRPNGQHRLARGTGWVMVHDLTLAPGDLVRPDRPVEVHGADALRRFVGVDSVGPDC